MMRLVLACLALASSLGAHADEPDDSPTFLVVVLDGLRPDYVTPDLMPNLYALGQRGVVFANHHSVYPTVTRVNSASISTGAYPTTHGLMGNTVYFPHVEPGKGLSTSDYRNLQQIADAEDGRMLTATTLGQALEASGHGVLAVSSGSSGSAFLLNPTLSGGGVINVDAILPESTRAQIEALIGPAPADAVPAKARNAWVVDAYVEYGLKRLKPAVTLMWLTDPDHTAHGAGVGAPLTVDALRAVDGDLCRILAAHTSLGIDDRVNVIVTSDHGFSTQTGGFNPSGLLSKNGLREGVVFAGGAIYVPQHDRDRSEAIVRLLQGDDSVGPIFTRAAHPGAHEGWVSGTLSFDAVQWDHARAADILVGPAWTDDANEYGYRGTTTYAGTAGHGSTSPFDIHNTLIAAGPAFKSGITSSVPSANPDIAPTVLHVLGVPAPESMTGRTLLESLVGGPEPGTLDVVSTTYEAKADDYRVEMRESVVDGRRYLDWARATR